MRTIFLCLGGLAALFVFWPSAKQPNEEAQARKELIQRYGPLETVGDNADMLVALATPATLTHSRRARITLSWPHGAFVGSDKEKKAKLREMGPDQAKRECQLLLQTFASKCEVAGTEGDTTGPSISLVIRLRFVQRQPFGVVSWDAPLTAYGIDLDYDAGLPLKQLPSPGSGTSAARRKIYAQIGKDLAAAVRTHRNATLFGVSVDSELVGPKGAQRINTVGRAGIAFIRTRMVKRPGVR